MHEDECNYVIIIKIFQTILNSYLVKKKVLPE